MEKTLNYYLADFNNTAEYNDFIFEEFMEATNCIEFLQAHRDFIEQNSLGFGDRAFHFMWYLLIGSLAQTNSKLSFLEIGVFKGQIISLWALIAKKLNLQNVEITGITPLEGKPRPKLSIVNKINTILSRKFREDVNNGNFYDSVDYESIINSVYENFSLDFKKTRLIKGYSNASDVIEMTRDKKYSIIYIDGDHSFQGALSDIHNYSCLLSEGGFLVMDDASCGVPGTKFWKGHQAVSDACEQLPKLGFTNILNVGHNRIFQRVNH